MTRITGTLRTSTGMNISDGPPVSVENTKTVVGPPGPPGPPTPVVITYDEWPPVDPQPGVLYLRLAP